MPLLFLVTKPTEAFKAESKENSLLEHLETMTLTKKPWKTGFFEKYQLQIDKSKLREKSTLPEAQQIQNQYLDYLQNNGSWVAFEDLASVNRFIESESEAGFIDAIQQAFTNGSMGKPEGIIIQIYVEDLKKLTANRCKVPGSCGELKGFTLCRNKNRLTPFTLDRNIFMISYQHYGKTYEYQANYPESYAKLLSTHSLKTEVDQVRELLKDYFKTWARRVLTCHWNRHHVKCAQDLYQSLAGNSPEEAFHLLWNLRATMLEEFNINRDGSFFQRLNFAIEYLSKKVDWEALRKEVLKMGTEI